MVSLDTLKNAVPQQQIDAIELMNRVDSFYSGAWDKLVLVVTLSFGVVGILIPIIIQWYQKQTLEIKERNLNNEIERKINDAKVKLKTEIEEFIGIKLKEYQSIVNKQGARSEARIFHLQGNSNVEADRFSQGIADWIVSCKNYLRADDFLNIRIILENLNKQINKISQEEIEDIKITRGVDLLKVIDSIDKAETKGLMTSLLNEIRLKVSKLPKTKPKIPTFPPLSSKIP